ncbi:6-phosphogluconolactonase [Roseobacter cerasinus]|uniref:6-phosphogluconolactonase n=1 Tax=Roseobacter cerasinus TaxID=2602289 RepID=A0A640VU09_9RHOB|nr:beta-propeller fold lactonase family protein [Roseobacter cerasinus]GFE49706.1 6-phosphogluconolactonase [Roseobacter cerasinus]
MTTNRNYTAYVSCLSGNEINVFSGHDVTGDLEQVQTIVLPGRGTGLVGRGLPLAQAPDRRRLYAAVYGDQTGPDGDLVDTYAIDPVTGHLTHMSSTPVMAQLSHISVDRTGGFLLGASEPSGLVVAYPLGDHGLVQARASDSVVPLPGAHQILTDYTNRYAYVPSLSDDILVSLRFDERTGRFTANTPPEIPLQTGAGCRHLAFHPNRRSMYLLNQRDGSLICYRLDAATGGLQELTRTSILPEGFAGSPWGAQIKVSPRGDRLFASERRSNSFAVWDIDENSGRPLDRHIVATPENPRCFDVTPNGRFAVLSALKGDCIALYDVSRKSAAPEKRLELPTGGEPGWVEIL